MMRYPILIEEGGEHSAFGVVVPDLPGCFSAGDTLDEALDGAKEAISGWVDAALDHGEAVPPPSSLEQVRLLPGYQGWTIAIVEVDAALFDDSIERVNITLPKRVLRRLDDLAAARHQSRGAFISELTMKTTDDWMKLGQQSKALREGTNAILATVDRHFNVVAAEPVAPRRADTATE